MARYALEGSAVLLSFVLASAAATGTTLAGEPSCTRVLPAPDFPRRELVPEHTVVAHARVGKSGERGLVLVRRDDPQPAPWSRYFVQSGRPDGAGGLALGAKVRLPEPDGGGRPRALFSGDFDGDGIDDAVVYWEPSSRGVAAMLFLRGDGDGRYDAPVRQAIGVSGLVDAPLAGDFDGDGRLEIAAPTRSSLSLLGIDDRARWSSEAEVEPFRFWSPAVVDWNDDGRDDLAVLSRSGGPTFVSIALGAEHDPLSTAERVEPAFPLIALGVLDGGLLAIEGRRIGWFETRYEKVHRLERGAPETWVLSLPEGSSALYPSVDLDGDGAEELLHGRSGGWLGPARVGFHVYWGERSGAPTSGGWGEAKPEPIASLDLDDDGVRDWITSDFAALVQRTPRQMREGIFATPVSVGGFVDEPTLHTDVGDLDEDGLDDLVVACRYPEVLGVARSTGDGAFELMPIEADPLDFDDPHLADLDGDGHLDLAALRRSPGVAWGRGDGTFFPIDSGAAASYRTTRRYGQLDAGEPLDRVELRCEDARCDPATLVTALGVNRGWHATAFTLELPSDRYDRSWTVADLDGDGLEDFVIVRRTAEEPVFRTLVWRRALGDGVFGDERRVVDFEFERAGALVPTDFDLDGVTDLFVASTLGSDDPHVSLRGRGDGTFEVVWTGPRLRRAGVSERLVDVDGDGRPDLLAGEYSGYRSPQYYVRLRRGDGLGGFLPAESPPWRGAPGPPGTFREGRRDLARLMAFSSSRVHLELFESEGRVLPRDVAPPHVDIHLSATDVPDAWRVATVPIDECDDRPRVVRRVVEMLPVRPRPEPAFRHGDAYEVRIYELPEGRRRDVLLVGPDEARARAIYAEAVERRGFEFEHFGRLTIEISDAYGAERGPTIPATRLVQRFFVEDGRCVGVEVTRPNGDVSFAADAVDRAGRRGTTRRSFIEAVRLPGA